MVDNREDIVGRTWLIRKDGYFYRPNKSGYTTSKAEAGRYNEADAKRECEIEPWHMKAIHENEWPDDPVSKDVNDQIATLRTKLETVEAETRERCANLGYAICAETRHVTLGNKVAEAIRNMDLRHKRDAQTRAFALGDRVTKTKGSCWTGRIVGFYSTTHTPVGYCVESETERGSVQIYPEAALKLMPGPDDG